MTALRVPFEFTRHLLALPPFWVGFVLTMGALNGMSLLWLHTAEGLVVATLFYGFALPGMMLVFWRYGFVRLLGLGHLPWLLLVPWLVHRVSDLSGAQLTWVLALIAVNTVSVLIDVKDVLLWIRGDREPTLVLDA